MAHYDITYDCGHTARIELFGRGRDCERKIEWLETLNCPDCQKKEAEAKVQKFEQEFGLPELTGTPKQIAWARKIRKAVLENLDEEACRWEQKGKADRQQYALDVMNLFAAQIASRFWIDNRGMSASIKETEKIYQQLLSEQSEEAGEAKHEAIVTPEGGTQSDGAVVVEVKDNMLTLEYHKDQTFINIAKRNGFEWYVNTFRWERPIYPVETPEDQIGEIAHHLLKAGFSCCILNDIAREKVISGAYKPIGTRILCSNKDKFLFRILNKNDDDFDAITSRLKKIGGEYPSYYSKNNIRVKGTMYRAVADIAAEYGFTISDGAKKLLESQVQSEIMVSVGDCMEPEKIKRISKKIIESNDPLADLIDD